MRCLTGGAIPAEIAKLEGKNAAGATIGFVNGEFLTLVEPCLQTFLHSSTVKTCWLLS